MKYAVVNTDKAISAGFKKEYHMLSSDKSRMIVNENELNTVGDAEMQANRLEGTLISRKELNVILNSEIWNK